MSALLNKEIDRLKKNILTLGGIVEERVHLAAKAIHDRDEGLARKIINGDPEVNRHEVDLEEECLKILALHQPVAVDLRFIISVIKINTSLERIADLAVNIAERAAFLSTQTKIDIPFDFPGMSGKVKAMLKKSLDAFVNMDVSLASEVLGADDEVDAINRKMYKQVSEGIRKHPDAIDRLIHILSVSRHLERIADHTTHIAEDVIYMIEGRIVRHQAEDFKNPSL
jgi:phosphate transport system protein